MTYTNVNGARFHYRLDGAADAPVVVLSNSLGTNLAMWDSQIPALSQKFRVLRYDSRGHGQSDVAPGPYTIETLGRDVVGLLDALQIPTAHYCGLSVGGLIGQWLGINASKRFKSLTLCNTAARIGTVEGWNSRIASITEGGMAPIANGVASRWFTEDFAKRAPATVEATRQMLLHSLAGRLHRDVRRDPGRRSARSNFARQPADARDFGCARRRNHTGEWPIRSGKNPWRAIC